MLHRLYECLCKNIDWWGSFDKNNTIIKEFFIASFQKNMSLKYVKSHISLLYLYMIFYDSIK